MLVIVSRLNRVIVILKVNVCTCSVITTFYVKYICLALGRPGCNIRDDGTSRLYRV